MFLGQKIDKTETNSEKRPFFTLEKIFPLSICDRDCMLPPPFKNPRYVTDRSLLYVSNLRR